MLNTNPLWTPSFSSLFIVLALFSNILFSPAALAQDSEQDTPLTASITNFEAVTPGLWRGGEPDEKGLQNLAQSGVSTIIDLRMWNGATDKESKSASKLGLKYVRIPMTYWGPSRESVRQFFATIAANRDGVTFVHCHQGADRTGTLVALYRVLVQKWEYPRVYKEMRAHHFKPWLFTLKEKIETSASAAYVPEKRLLDLLATCSGTIEKTHVHQPAVSLSPGT
ncbi:MAG: tyrosine-protein phosphatase [Candidatus Obscuribacterales bacterium]|nr:tyrosine-protein phosphatase [Candidatus Obscuribacterales bacterium]